MPVEHAPAFVRQPRSSRRWPRACRRAAVEDHRAAQNPQRIPPAATRVKHGGVDHSADQPGTRVQLHVGQPSIVAVPANRRS